MDDPRPDPHASYLLCSGIRDGRIDARTMEKVICDLGWINDTQGPVDAMLIAAAVGLIVGTICFGVLALSLWFTRSYRQARNPIVLGLLYLLFPALGIGSLILRALNESLGIVRQSVWACN